MSDITIFFGVDPAYRADEGAGPGLSLRARALIITALALAAWVPVVLPIYLLLHH